MPGTLVPNQMYDHETNVLKGWPHPHAVDKSADIAAGETILAGRVCYLDADAKFRLGLPENVVGCFAWPNSTDFDVSADVGNIQKGVMMALPCIAAYELYTTEFDPTFTYVPNDHLSAWDDHLPGFDPLKKGMVFPAQPYENTIVGVVTEAVKVNDFKKSVLPLWTYYLPIVLGS